ncbi:MAG: AcrR family transcriptional regulator [Candidatus Krumholzibacteriia bacterium]|jgi:AcrR family transcriptional regulator
MDMTKQIRKSGDERRIEIAQAILRIIGERGLAALTTAGVAEEVGVSAGALFRHFASRDEMVSAAAELALQMIDQTFPSSDLAPLDRVVGLARNRAELLRSELGIAWLLKSDQAHLVLLEGAAQKVQEMGTRSKNFLRQAILEGREDGTIRTDVQPEVIMVTVMGTIHALTGISKIHSSTDSQSKLDPEIIFSGLKRMLATAG